MEIFIVSLFYNYQKLYEMKKFYLFIALICVCTINAFAQPTVAANTPPARNTADVISLFSNAYTNANVDTWRTSWSNATLTDLQIAGNDTKLYSNLDFVGIEFVGPNMIDATSMQFYHIDVWTANATVFRVKLVDFGANGVYAGGDDSEHEYVVSPLTQAGWNSYDITMSSFAGLASKAHLAQMIFSALPTAGANVYVDNVYMYRVANAPALSNFTVPAKLSNDAPFTITAPTSNSSGAFTYTSSNTAVATVSGNTITIVGAGNSVITANQAAAAPYSAGSITATLVVTPAVLVPMVAAPTPTQPAANVISLFSNAYTNVPVDTWRTSWSNATLTDLQIAGNDTKLYSNLDFVGVEFVGANVVNATAMQTFHIDVWTANATTFRVKLVDFGANGTFGGGDDSEHEIVVSPLTQAGWNSYDIPLANFTGLTSKAHLAQMIFSALPTANANVYVDNVYFYNVPTTTPMVAAPTPIRLAANVISLFSNAYTNVPVDTWLTSWSAAALTDLQIAGNDTKLYNNLDFAGIETVGANMINATPMDGLHIDVWTPNATVFRVKVVDFGANGSFGGGDDVEHEISLTPLNQGSWNSYDIPFSSLPGLTTRGHVAQLIISALPAGTSKVYIDNVYFYKVPTTTPMVAAPTPTRLAANVISLFSNAYTNVPVDTWLTSWSAAALTDLQIAGNDTKLYNNLDFAGIETVGANMINATPMDGLHIDVWTPNATVFRVKVVDFGANGSFGGGDDVEHEISLTPLNQGSWNSYDIPFSSLPGLTTRGHVAQLIISAVPTGTSKVYIDNVYFYKVPPTTPMVAAPNPPNRTPSDVISIYGGVYTNLAGVDMAPFWGQSIPVVITDELIQGNPTKKYANLSYQGTQLAAPINLTTFDKLHLDIWTPNCTNFKVSLVNTTVGNEQAFTIIPVLSGWNSIDIPLTAYSNLVAAIDLSAISQLKFEAVPFGSSTIFLDNLYFYKGLPLPITLASFDAVKKGSEAKLDWVTSMESNNKGFHIQRSKNATNWETLDFLNGVGYSNQDNAYTYTDGKPTSGVNYYRLKQEDFNGRTSYSDIKVLRFTDKQELNLTVFPNPTREAVYVDLSSFGSGNATLSLVNAAGKIILTKNISILNGNYNTSINVSKFAKGNYVLQVKNAGSSISKVLVIE